MAIHLHAIGQKSRLRNLFFNCQLFFFNGIMLALYKRTKYVYIHIVTNTEMLWGLVNIFVRGGF